MQFWGRWSHCDLWSLGVFWACSLRNHWIDHTGMVVPHGNWYLLHCLDVIKALSSSKAREPLDRFPPSSSKLTLSGLFQSSWTWLVFPLQSHTWEAWLLLCLCLPSLSMLRMWLCAFPSFSHLTCFVEGCDWWDIKGHFMSWRKRINQKRVGCTQGRWRKRPKRKDERVKIPRWLTSCANLQIPFLSKVKILPSVSRSEC